MAKEDYSTISVRLAKDEKEGLLRYCEDNDLTMSQVLRKMIKELISKQEEV